MFRGGIYRIVLLHEIPRGEVVFTRKLLCGIIGSRADIAYRYTMCARQFPNSTNILTG